MRSEGCAVIDLLGPDEVQSLLQAWQDLKVTSQRGFDSTILSTDPHYRMQVDRQIRRHIAARTTILAPGHRIAFCTFAVKAAYGAGSEVPLHQDWSFVDETRFASFGLWCPLVDVGPENGCLQVVKGSHAFPHPPRAACSPFAYPELVEQLSARVTSLPMRAGQAVVFDNRLFHCSPPNRTAFERVAATAVIVPCECRLRYYHMPDRTRPYLIEVFEVDDSFYLSHVAPGRPMAGKSLGFVDVRDDGSASRTQPGQGRP
jgi:ectoine hydroxylase-related dioxygenase (phytanoyl-CoA dioxygenase family)